MKNVIIAMIAAMSIGTASLALADGSGDGALRTQAISEQKVKDLRAAMAQKAADEAEKQAASAQGAEAPKS